MGSINVRLLIIHRIKKNEIKIVNRQYYARIQQKNQ